MVNTGADESQSLEAQIIEKVRGVDLDALKEEEKDTLLQNVAQDMGLSEGRLYCLMYRFGDKTHVAKTIKGAFLFDGHVAQGTSFLACLKKYFFDQRYQCVVNFRLNQYFYQRQVDTLYGRGIAERITSPGTVGMALYKRIPKSLMGRGLGLLAAHFENKNMTKYNVTISARASVAPNFWGSFRNLGIAAWARVGENAVFSGNVTLAAAFGDIRSGCPKLGKNVKIYTGAVVVGDISIGDDVIIGANAVVTKPIPSRRTVFVPEPRVIPRLAMK